MIVQYLNSPRIKTLVSNLEAYFDLSVPIESFYKLVFNVDTAQGFGLDIWGAIVGVDRDLQVAGDVDNFGFYDGTNDYKPFGSAPFYQAPLATTTYTLADDAYRILILAKALSNVSATTPKAINQLLQNLFPDRGRCYVNDLGNMQMRYTFEFYLEPYEEAIVKTSGVLPKTSGVSVSVLQVEVPYVFGFSEMGTHDSAPFGQGTFYTE